MKYLLDSCIWIDFFAKGTHQEVLSSLLMNNFAYTNKAILSELIPAARMKKENLLINCLSGLEQVPLSIDWNVITEIQYMCLKKGLNKIGLIDIVIAQNAQQHDLGIFSSDKHMEMISQIMDIEYRKE
jgi:predicted nucleic acid-binding protein